MKKILQSSILLTVILGTVAISIGNVQANTSIEQSNNNGTNDQKENTKTILNINNSNQSTKSLLENNQNGSQKTNNTGNLTLDYVPKDFNFNDQTHNNGDFIYKNVLNDDNGSRYIQVSDYRPVNKDWTLNAKLSTPIYIDNNKKNDKVHLKVKDLIFEKSFALKKTGLNNNTGINETNINRKTIDSISMKSIMTSNEMLNKNNEDVSTVLKGFKKVTMESERKSGSYEGNITWELSTNLNNSQD
ncbi:hypothetical protein DY037_01590 [Apilactobacillus micheneri]|uniref:WxL domain-containing protein n=1 Tax=Apilactobacillus micheneri TaxID=1899430 RepID=UPI00112DB29B|nr:WxL domain-containing protein [Apilactobacillus micheneri]TPR39146.1 hypothetical protein DY119_05655 [Apilactobacillus micheneri]TPR50668.1 hypothetical protein DY037_01590 [Apilactobacillus micheneri]